MPQQAYSAARNEGERAPTGRKGMCGARAHYPAHIPRYSNRQLLQVIRPFADRLERVIVHADAHHIQAPQGAAPATDQVGTEAGGEHGSVALAPDSQRFERRRGEDGEEASPGCCRDHGTSGIPYVIEGQVLDW